MEAEPLHSVVVVGDGGWGTALALLLEAAGRDVHIWSHDPAYAEVLRRERTNPRFLPGFAIPPRIGISADLAGLVGEADLLISAVPTAYLREVWTRHAPLLPTGLPVLSVSKGLEQGTLLRPSEILGQILGADRTVGVLSGPNIAREIADGLPAASVVSAPDEELTGRVQATLSTDRFRIYSNPDLVGVELGGVLKNVIALAAGMCDGMRLGANAKAALVTRGLLEMARLGEILGGHRSTFFGLSGLGDLITTCESRSSRNRTFGERMGQGERVEDIAASMSMVAEGVRSAAPVHDLMREHALNLPIHEEVYRVVSEGKSPQAAVQALMTRASRDEAQDLVPA